MYTSKKLLNVRLRVTLSVHRIGCNVRLKLLALVINLSVNNMPTIKTEYKSAGEAFTAAYKLITVEKQKAKLYKEAGNWYVETCVNTTLTNNKE
jgi:hypothetical protein